MSIFKLRPHHALCISFFEGKGYSDEFVKNMTEVIKIFESINPIVEITENADIICSKCPHCVNSRCTGEKVTFYDRKVLEICSPSKIIHWKDFHDSVRKNIIDSHRLEEVCGNCQWSYICKSKARS